MESWRYQKLQKRVNKVRGADKLFCSCPPGNDCRIIKVEDGANAHRGATMSCSKNDELETYGHALGTVRGYCGKCKRVKDSSKGLTGLIYCSFCFLQNDHFGALFVGFAIFQPKLIAFQVLSQLLY